ncbi:MAG TPA: zinc ribbon domain-containing protein [Longimicrobium sp.]|jgi:hypothetical protein
MTPRNDAGPQAGSDVEELIRQREQLRTWIAKLDEVGTGAPSRVAERVRADYQERLTRVTGELGAHREEIERDLEAVRGALSAAEERRAQAAEALEEQRLRHLIGELDEAAWEQARPRLESDVGAADDELARARGEVERLSGLAAEIAGPEPAAAELEAEPEIGDGYGAAAAVEPGLVGGFAPEPEAGFGGAAEDEYEPVIEFAGDVEGGVGETARAEGGAPAAEAGTGAEVPSGEDLAAWISEVEAEVGFVETGPAPAAGAPAEDGWDPLANEFGGAPASPQTQPGDAADELPWLDAAGSGGGAGWAAAPAEGGDELAFLKDLEEDVAPADAAAGGELEADDLAFLEELDRAISGGAQRPAAPAPAEPAAEFTGGSGDGFSPAGAAPTKGKSGEALLCKECGAINEPQAWYCEICGSEL